MNLRRLLILIGILGISILLAFPLREAVYNTIVVPVVFVLWVLGLYYHSVDQSIWWFLALIVVLILLFRSIFPGIRFRRRKRIKPRPVTGPVEKLSVWIKRTSRGTYFKWLVANRLGKIAHQILSQRMGGKLRSFFDPLAGPDWAPDAEVQSYLETGLKSSFADFPRVNQFFSRPEKTPLDQDVNDVIEYLESQVEVSPRKPG